MGTVSTPTPLCECCLDTVDTCECENFCEEHGCHYSLCEDEHDASDILDTVTDGDPDGIAYYARWRGFSDEAVAIALLKLDERYERAARRADDEQAIRESFRGVSR